MKHTTKRLLLIALVVLSALALTACVTTAGQYEKAQKMMARGEYAEAAEAFAELGSYEDSSNLTLYCRACAAAEAGDYDTAISTPGKYRLTVADKAGNETVYEFALKYQVNMYGVAAVLLCILVIVGVVVFVLHTKKNMKIR